MKAFLLYRDQDFDLGRTLPRSEKALTQDLALDTLFNGMARGDGFLFEVVRKVVLSSLTDPDAIVYRQDILRDCLRHEAIVRGLYDLATEAIDREKKEHWSFFARYPSGILHRAVDVLQLFVGMLRRLRAVGDQHGEAFESEGFRRFFQMLKDELADEYFAEIEEHLQLLKFRGGVLISARLGKGSTGIQYVLRKPNHAKRGWMARILGSRAAGYTFHLHPRDEGGARFLSELTDRGLNLVANALAQSTDHISSFFQMLRRELAFYVGCLNLLGALAQREEPVCFPVAASSEERMHSFTGLYDVCLALSMDQRVVGNDLRANGKDLFIVTGANQGGKSTFLRAIGVAQLMAQAGMFTPAESFHCNVCEGLFTHYKREEDTTMKSGKLDEELARMSHIVEDLKPNCMLLFNESFAATNEREGSEIARQITTALMDRKIKVFFVTHLFEFARGLHEKQLSNAVFLRAERRDDGERTFRLVEGEPLQTSYGEDLYERVFAGVQSSEGM